MPRPLTPTPEPPPPVVEAIQHPPAAPAGASLKLSEVLAALSYALDLTEGQAPGHTLRSCLIGMRIATELKLDSEQCSALYYALLLKDAGCSSNAARMASLFGSDDRIVKPKMKMVDWQRRAAVALETARSVGIGQSLGRRVAHFVEVAQSPDVTRELIEIRCERGADIARRIGFPELTAGAIRSLDEHWSGDGHPSGLAGEQIPLLARIANVSQTVEAHLDARGLSAAMRMLRVRRGRWFDPHVADVVLGWCDDAAWWAHVQGATAADVQAVEPQHRCLMVTEAQLDDIALAFADIIDAKSPFTYQHSSRVAGYAVSIARELGLAEADQHRIFRAGLLHDVGKLGISNSILDKPGLLTQLERTTVETHPRHTFDILQRVSAFNDIAWTAALHHEKLDGTGYPWKLGADELDEPARVLAVADMYDALTSARPYRAPMAPGKAMAIIGAERGTRLCLQACEALEGVVHKPMDGTPVS